MVHVLLHFLREHTGIPMDFRNPGNPLEFSSGTLGVYKHVLKNEKTPFSVLVMRKWVL